MKLLNKEEYSHVLSQVRNALPSFKFDVEFAKQYLKHSSICINKSDFKLNDTTPLIFTTFNELNSQDQQDIIEDIIRENNIRVRRRILE